MWALKLSIFIVYFFLQTKQSKVYVEVCSLTLHSDSSISQDPTVELLFVDYHGFLGLPPDQLETPHSLPKPPPGCVINFNFGQGNYYSIYVSLIFLLFFSVFLCIGSFWEEPDYEDMHKKETWCKRNTGICQEYLWISEIDNDNACRKTFKDM